MIKSVKEKLTEINNSFSSEELDIGLKLFKKKLFHAKDIMSKSGEISKYLFFAESTITRCYYIDSEGLEQTLWMKPEGTFIAEYKSFTRKEKSQFNLQFYEDSWVHMISRDDLLYLYKKYNNWALFGNYLTEKVHVSLIDVFVNLLANDATSNYRYIEYMFPRFIQVAPLKDIASMLQVSQVTLSRIRSGKQLKR